MMKNFAIVERLKVQFRAEAFNVFNHPSAGNPNATFGASNFGTVSSIQQVPGTISGARVLSLSGKIIF